jgi:excisionase family DNA binding protein
MRKRCLVDNNPEDILTIEELSVSLKIPKPSLYKVVREGKIPCQKIGPHWRFRKAALDRWLEASRLPSSDTRRGA